MQSETITYLENMADKLRIHSVEMTSKAGSGHPTSCMSAAEIMSVLFFHQMKYDPGHPDSLENDAFILSKGHAAPILYAAYAEAGSISTQELMDLRSFSSVLEGHPLPRIAGVKAATGSLGQGLSVGAGIALSQRRNSFRPNQQTYVLLGDGEMAEGNVWEAMNFASCYNLDNLTAIIDMNRLGQSEETMFGWSTAEYEARARAFGWRVITVDGHSVTELLEAFETVKDKEGPVCIIAKTKKGKKGGSAEDKEGYHGKPLPDDEYQKVIESLKSNIKEVEYSPPNFIEAGEYSKSPSNFTVETDYKIGETEATRTAFGNALVKLGKKDEKLIVLDGDVKGSSRTKGFFKEFPDRSIEAYIAEQNIIGVMIGLQAWGDHPAASTFAAFLTRAHDQLRMGAYSGAKMLIAGSHTGVSIGADGPSQMGLEDIAMMRTLYGSTVLSPSDAVSAEKLTAAALGYDGTAYLRTIRGKTIVLYENSEEFVIGGSKTLKEAEDDYATFVATGITVAEALDAAVELEEELGIHIRVIDCYSLKPLDEMAIKKAARDTKAILSIEDHFPEGGLGEAVAAAASGETKVSILSVTKKPHSGSPDKLTAEQGIDKEGIKKKFKEIYAQ